MPERDRTPPPVDLVGRVYDELRAIAAAHLRGEGRNHTLEPTAIVHEAFIRLAEMTRLAWRDERHFAIAAAGAIRRVLVDHARARNARKRGRGWRQVTLCGLEDVSGTDALDALALDEALERLHSLDPRKARVVELRYFGGLTIEETAQALGVGTTTVEDDWAFARAWLRRELGGGAS